MDWSSRRSRLICSTIASTPCSGCVSSRRYRFMVYSSRTARDSSKERVLATHERCRFHANGRPCLYLKRAQLRAAQPAGPRPGFRHLTPAAPPGKFRWPAGQGGALWGEKGWFGTSRHQRVRHSSDSRNDVAVERVRRAVVRSGFRRVGNHHREARRLSRLHWPVRAPREAQGRDSEAWSARRQQPPCRRRRVRLERACPNSCATGGCRRRFPRRRNGRFIRDVTIVHEATKITKQSTRGSRLFLCVSSLRALRVAS